MWLFVGLPPRLPCWPRVRPIPELGTGQPVELVPRLDPGTQSLATRVGSNPIMVAQSVVTFPSGSWLKSIFNPTNYLMQPYVDGKVCVGAPTQDPTPVLSCPLGFSHDTQPLSTNSVRQRFTRTALHGSWFTKAWERAFGQACTVMQGCITMCWHTGGWVG